VNTIDDFLTIVRDELGLPVEADDAARSLDQIPGWDSMHLLWLCTALERETGRTISLPDVLRAPSLAGIYELAVTE
jgi:acyl carrier protein